MEAEIEHTPEAGPKIRPKIGGPGGI